MKEERTIQNEMLIVAENMQEFGGGFVSRLGMALGYADLENAAKIKAAFPEYWTKYLSIKGTPAEGAIDDEPHEEYEKDDDGSYRAENGFDARDHYRGM